MDKPKRRYELTLTLAADDIGALRGALNSIEFDIDRHEEHQAYPLSIVSGGYSSGFVLEVNVDPAITHETWEVALGEYLEHLRSIETAAGGFEAGS